MSVPSPITTRLAVPSPLPAADEVDGVAHAGPERDLADAGPDDVAGDGAHDGAGRVVGTVLAEPAGPVGDDGGHVGQGLDVVDQGRGSNGLGPGSGHLDMGGHVRLVVDVVLALDDLDHPPPVGRSDPREGRPSRHDLEESGLLTEQIVVRTGHDRDGYPTVVVFGLGPISAVVPSLGRTTAAARTALVFGLRPAPPRPSSPRSAARPVRPASVISAMACSMRRRSASSPSLSATTMSPAPTAMAATSAPSITA
jgi:hypothetical protein